VSFDNFVRFAYGREPEEFEPTEEPGYWQTREPCGGLDGGCREPIHRVLFCESGTRHTIQYRDPRRGPGGRWQSPYLTWAQARAAFTRHPAKASGQ